MRYLKNVLLDCVMFFMVYVAISLVVMSLIGWVITFVVIFTDNNWLPFFILTTSALIVSVLASILGNIKVKK